MRRFCPPATCMVAVFLALAAGTARLQAGQAAPPPLTSNRPGSAAEQAERRSQLAQPDVWTVDAGCAWVTDPNVQWDLSAGHSFRHRGDAWFVSGGLTLRHRRRAGP